MEIRQGIAEDLLELLPSTPFKVLLSSKQQEEDVCVVEEVLDFEDSNELLKIDHIRLYSSKIRVYIEATYKNSEYESILTYLTDFFDAVSDLEDKEYKGKNIQSVKKLDTFGYLGETQQGNYCFSLNFVISYYI